MCFHFWFENPGLLTNNHFAHTSAMRYIHKWCLEKYGISFDKMTIWADGCPTTYKNQFAVAGLEWLRRNCVMSSVTNNFTGTGCFKGQHDGEGKIQQQFIQNAIQQQMFTPASVWDSFLYLAAHFPPIPPMTAVELAAEDAHRIMQRVQVYMCPKPRRTSRRERKSMSMF